MFMLWNTTNVLQLALLATLWTAGNFVSHYLNAATYQPVRGI